MTHNIRTYKEDKNLPKLISLIAHLKRNQKFQISKFQESSNIRKNNEF